MYLKSLEISGFKSFAKKCNLDFKSSITAIVGPNGSGKSNVAEAFRFVLGEQSIKSLRGKRGEDLIWNGSQEVPRAGRAFVKTVFDNSKKVFNVDFDEVSIERVVNRDGTNEYSINGSPVRLKDVLELLSGSNIGASGHHIISQGEADRILSANIKERRSMIEDALGLKIFQYKREESERKLAKTAENITQVESLRREIAPHLRFLKRQVDKMSKAVETKDKLAVLYKEYLKRESLYLDFNKKINSELKGPLIEKSKQLEDAIDKAEDVLASSDRSDGKSQRLLAVDENIRISRRSKDQLERELGKVEGEMNANLSIIENENRKLRSVEASIAFAEVEKMADEVFRDSERGQNESNIDSVKSILKSIGKKIKNFLDSNKKTETTSMMEELKYRVETLGEEKKKLEDKINKEVENLAVLDKSYNEIRAEIEAEKDSERGAEREIFRISSELSAVNNEINTLRLKEESLKSLEENLSNEMREVAVILGNMALGFDKVEVSVEDVKAEARQLQEERRKELEKMKIRLEEFGAAGGEEVLKEYNDVSERDQFFEKELNDLKNSSIALQKIIDELDEKLDVEFKEGIRKINISFQDFFALMFGGGTAKLQVVKSQKTKIKYNPENEDSVEEIPEEEDSEEGIDIDVSLPKKRIKGLTMLSGGERALTSIALLFAMSQVNPPPFIILDETDAALDEANSKKYGDMIEQLSKYSQLILITHNRETMSRAGIIYGVTMGSNGVSRLLSIAFDDAVAVAK